MVKRKAAAAGAAGQVTEKRFKPSAGLYPRNMMLCVVDGQTWSEDATSVSSMDTTTTSQTLASAETPATLTAETPTTLTTEASDITTLPKRPSNMKVIPCTVPGCLKKFNRQARLDAHLRAHNNERPFVCDYEGCDKAYTDNKFLKRHLESAHLKLSKFVCKICGHGFATGQRLERHGGVHAPSAAKFRCRDYPPCNETFRKRKTLERHVLKDHQGKKPFVCDEAGCGESYATLNAWKAHTQREHGDEKFVCGPCSDKVMKDSSLKDRVKYGFTTKVQLEQHIRHMHIYCVYCGEGVAFIGQYDLERHMDIYHTGQTVEDRKTVVCDFDGCDKRFVKRSNMLTHLRTAHEGLRFICGKVDTSKTPGLERWNWKGDGCGQHFTNKIAAANHALYIHLRLRRTPWEPQQSLQSKKASSFLDEVSGVTDFERRSVKCTVSDCTARFVRYADMHKHVTATHDATWGSSETFSRPCHYAAGLDGQQDGFPGEQAQAFGQVSIRQIVTAIK